MKVLSKFKLDGNGYGYVLDDDGVNYPTTERGLYDQDIMEGLIKDGYKILNYHGDILTPEGINIKDMVEGPCTATEDEIQTMYDIADYAMTEAAAASYFARDVEIKAVEFKEPKVEISTREELLAYLQRCKKTARYASVAQDVRPLNSFVAKEALFTAEEIARDSDVRGYFKIIEGRRKLQSFKAYEDLVHFLQGEGVLGESYTAGDVKTAYLSWGICGLKTPVTNTYTKIGVTTDICADSEAMGKRDSIAGRLNEVCLMDKLGVVYYSGGSVDLSDCEDFAMEPVAPINESKYFDLLHSVSKWTADYMPITCLVNKYRNRTYYEMLDENGVAYTAKVDVDALIIKDARSVIQYGEFLFLKCIDGTYVSIEKISTSDEYWRYNLLKAKARDLVQYKTVKPPVTNTYQLLLQEGVSPETAVRYIARRIKQDPNLNAAHQTGINYSFAYQHYKDGPSKELIQKYNPNGYEYSNIDELIEIMCATRNEMEEKGEYLLISKDSIGPDANFIREEIRMRPIENLEFVKMVKEGNLTIDNLFQGKLSDGIAEIDSIANLIDLTVKIKHRGENVSTDKLIDDIREITSYELVDFDKAVKERSAAYRGYLRDKAKLNKYRAEESPLVVYVTKVYRELANAHKEDLRHYMFECQVIQADSGSEEEKLMYTIAKNIQAVLDDTDELSYDLRDIGKMEAPVLAYHLMFMISLGKIEASGKAGSCEIFDLPYSIDGTTVVLKVSVPLDKAAKLKRGQYNSKKLCTLNDWCVEEMSTKDGCENAFNNFCLNANITPWEVIPKKGVKIPCYNFCLNYVCVASLSGLSDSFRARIESERAKVDVFRDNFIERYLFDYSVLDLGAEFKVEYTVNNIDVVLQPAVEETLDLYNKRFKLKREEAVRKGMYLQFMPLKADIRFSKYADSFDVKVVNECIYAEPSSQADTSLYLSEITPTLLTDGVVESNLLESGNKVYEFNINDYTFADLARWTDIANGTFKSQAICFYAAGNLIVARNDKKLTINLKTLDKDSALKLVGKDIFYQLDADRFMVNTIDQSIVVEVK